MGINSHEPPQSFHLSNPTKRADASRVDQDIIEMDMFL